MRAPLDLFQKLAGFDLERLGERQKSPETRLVVLVLDLADVAGAHPHHAGEAGDGHPQLGAALASPRSTEALFHDLKVVQISSDCKA